MATAIALAVAAQTLTASAAETAAAPAQHSVLDATAPTLALQHPALPTSGRIVTEPGDWKAANAAVAAFPRGHADVLRWEKSQTAQPQPPLPTAEPQSPHLHHPHEKGQP